MQKIDGLTDSDGPQSQNHGKIYNAWRDLKTTSADIEQKSIIDCSLYDETIALYTFEAELDKNIEMDEEARQLIEDQENELKKIKDEVKNFRKTNHIISYDGALSHY